MRHEVLPLWEKKAYTYDSGVDFMPTLTTYVLDGVNVKDAVLVIPGGGYGIVSPSEAEVVALKFLEAGINSFVLTYTVRARPSMPPVGMQPLRDASRAMVMIRENAENWGVNPNHIGVCGFSAGGHLAASLSVFWDETYLKDIPGIDRYSNRPNASVLSYPVITAGETAHPGSFYNLLGDQPTKEGLNSFSLEKHVGPKTPPTFLWHTFADDVVPVENSLLYAGALRKANIPFEMHIFPTERHGTSTADKPWSLQGNDILGSPCGQMDVLLAQKELEEQGIEVTEASLRKRFAEHYEGEHPQEYIQPGFVHNKSWIKLCMQWLELTFGG